MFEVTAPDGRKRWINVLMVKAVETTPDPDEFRLLMLDNGFMVGKGSPASVAAAITRLLRSIHGGT